MTLEPSKHPHTFGDVTQAPPQRLGPVAVAPRLLPDGKTEALGFEHGTPLLQCREQWGGVPVLGLGVAYGGCPFTRRQQSVR